MLYESDRHQVVADAASDGSSYLCEACGGLVSMARRANHETYWCVNDPPPDEDSDGR